MTTKRQTRAIVVCFCILAFSQARLAAQSGPAGGDFNAVVPLAKVGASPSYGAIISLKDGRLLWIWGTGSGKLPAKPIYQNTSRDGGRTWSDPSPVKLSGGTAMTGVFNVNLFRLKSGALGLIQNPRVSPDLVTYHISRDEGETWSPGTPIGPEGTSTHLTSDRAIVLSDGRIILPVYAMISSTPAAKKPKIAQFGESFGGGAAYAMYYAFVYFSDDEGKTWKRSKNEVFALKSHGFEGIYPLGEPAIAELPGGTLFMLGRTGLGCHFRSYSDDRGETWKEAEPNSLVSPPAPAALARIPGTGDLLVVWNQVSEWEYMTGLYRHRLSCAISKDAGKTWQHHKNLESLDDTNFIPPGEVHSILVGKFQQPLDRARYLRAPGPLRSSYPTLAFADGKAIVSYGISTFGDKQVITGTYGLNYDDVLKRWGLGPEGRANKIRILPVEWFYK